MSAADSIQDYVAKNSDMLSRILACGNEEARAYALALLANAGDTEGLEDVQSELDRLKLNAR
ncbi:hypothetical protein [Halobaculum sp. D14]|uniref:hypothetical protein n=1 Tax=Halobaculum sp. D14 TaxID=3421642 RepID=UPI003EC0CC4B